jgi:hypothetical protein
VYFVICSRDKTELNELVCEKWFVTLLHLAGLVPQEEAPSRINESPADYEGKNNWYYIVYCNMQGHILAPG